MQIINTQPVRKVPSLEEVITNAHTSHIHGITALKTAVQVSFHTTWHNPDYTPEQIITALCQKYNATPEELFEVHKLSQELLVKFDSNYQPLVPPINEVEKV